MQRETPSQATVAFTTTIDGELLGATLMSESACDGLQARRTSSGASGHALANASRPATSNVSDCSPPADEFGTLASRRRESTTHTL